jgi:CRISPR/Cas system-associated exonuclease Cas4 (RecB family)
MKFQETEIMKSIINQNLMNNRKTKERGAYFYASEAYLPHNPDESACGRQLGYKVLGYAPEPSKIESQRNFFLGDMYHEFVQKIFVKEQLATHIEECTIYYDDDGKAHWVRQETNKIIMKVPVEIHGRLDIQFNILKEPFIADIKTVGEWAWKYLAGKPKEEHYAQVQLYLKDKKLNRGFLLYINKSSGDMKEFMLEYDDEYLNKYLEDYKNLYEFIKHKGLPPRHFRSGDEAPWQCKFCGFTKHCLGMTSEELKKKRFITYPEAEDATTK